MTCRRSRSEPGVSGRASRNDFGSEIEISSGGRTEMLSLEERRAWPPKLAVDCLPTGRAIWKLGYRGGIEDETTEATSSSRSQQCDQERRGARGSGRQCTSLFRLGWLVELSHPYYCQRSVDIFFQVSSSGGLHIAAHPHNAVCLLRPPTDQIRRRAKIAASGICGSFVQK
jgi:hypothetical protein